MAQQEMHGPHPRIRSCGPATAGRDVTHALPLRLQQIKAGRKGRVGWCPRWDSNPQPVAFKATSSAGWDTGARSA